MSFYQKFVRLCSSIGKPPSRVATECGIARSTVNKWKNGGNPTDTTLLTVADYFGVSPDYLAADEDAQPGSVGILDAKYAVLDDHGKHLVDLILGAEYERCTADSVDKVVPLRTIRHYLSRPAAGVGGLIEGEDYEDIPLPDDAPDGADYCLTVSGDSMSPLLNDGELIFVKRDVALEPQDIGVFIIDGEAYVKQFFPGIAGQTYLVSANPKRQDANITLFADSNHTAFCAGKVLLK